MAVSGDDSLNPRPEPLAGLRHGVPVKGPHLPFHLLDQVLDFLWGFSLACNSETPHTEKVQKVVIGQAGREDLLLSHLQQVLIEQVFVSSSCC